MTVNDKVRVSLLRVLHNRFKCRHARLLPEALRDDDTKTAV